MKIIGITKDSRSVEKNYAYFCFIGDNFDGHDFIDDAIKNGASAVYGTKPLSCEKYFQVDNIEQKFVEVACDVYNVNFNDFKFIGITGTDGKTSTALITHEILKSESAYVGTSGLMIRDKNFGYNGFTTPYSDVLIPFLRECKKQKIKYIIMEVSSHALEQNRLGDIKFYISCFTNITSDHLDFHKTLENYLASKLKIVDKTNGYFLFNKDDIKLSSLSGVSIGQENCDFLISNIFENRDGLQFNINSVEINTSMLVKFNAYNITFAYAICRLLEYDVDFIKEKIENYIVPGRMQVVSKTPLIIVDFAHTADAINNICEFANTVKKDGKLIVVTGSAGDRDKLKRPLMGEAASKYSDILILTEDDPRNETVFDINMDIKAGISNKNCKIIEIEKRCDAIECAITKANENDLIFLLGKAGQTRMYYDGYSEEYIEEEIVDSILKERSEH